MRFRLAAPLARTWLAAWLAGTVAAYVLASLCQSLFVMAALERAGAEFALATRLRVILHDLWGLTFGGAVPLAGTLLLAFALALPLAMVPGRLLRIPRAVLCALAGAAAVAVVLQFIQAGFFYHMTFMEGTRGALGYGSQLAAGALGGAVFAWCVQRGGHS